MILQDCCRYFLLESGFALFVAFLINVSIVSVSATVCTANNLSTEITDQCNDLTLNSASFLLKVHIINLLTRIGINKNKIKSCKLISNFF